MEPFDSAKATRIWQRVQDGLGQPSPDGIRALILEELENSAVFRHLSGMLPKKQVSLCRQLLSLSNTQSACLNGICALLSGTGAMPPGPMPQKGQPAVLLRKCYGRALRCLAEYDGRAAEPEYGPVFSQMAARQRMYCATLAELMGNLQI